MKTHRKINLVLGVAMLGFGIYMSVDKGSWAPALIMCGATIYMFWRWP